MKTPNWKNCSTEELWKYAAWHLAQESVDTILVGGAVVSIYSEGAYQSGDLDFITSESDLKKIQQVLAKIGFEKKAKYFQHPKCSHLFIEFVAGPLGIGDDLKIQPALQKVEGKQIKILSPTDCIRDRLASFIYFKARECLDQAVLVAKRHTFDVKKVKTWCSKEGALEQFKEFENLLKQ